MATHFHMSVNRGWVDMEIVLNEDVRLFLIKF